MLGHTPSSLRFGVLNVRDAYGETVGSGAVRTIHKMGLPYAGRFAYNPVRLDADRLIRRVSATHPDVLFVAAYLDDGIGDPTGDGCTRSPARREHRHVLELLHARVREPPRRQSRRAVRFRQARR